MLHKISFYAMVALYLLGGINHFVSPAAYAQLIPHYLPNPDVINIIAGAVEIGLAVLLLFPSTRKRAAYGIIALLIALIPAHIQMIQRGFCLSNGFCLPTWALWFRLVPMQFVLMWWAWTNRTSSTSN